MDWDSICYNAAAFIAGVFVLDYGADKFIDHTVIVGRRLGISPTLIALLTAGAEYEEVFVDSYALRSLLNADILLKLAVVVAAVIQHRSPLALGNIMGSTISNILGAFSLGLLFDSGGMEFDQSAKMYSTLQFCITTLFVVLAHFRQLNKVTGGIFIAIFAVYIISIGIAILRGIAQAPELSDSDSDDESAILGRGAQSPDPETSPLLGNEPAAHEIETTSSNGDKKPPRSLSYHIYQLILGLLSLSLAGYILAHSAGTIADSLHLSGTVFGLTVIAFATTLPEKFIAILSGSRGQGGIVVASTAGSNIFLLTLCVGVVAVAGIPTDQSDTFVTFDLVAIWVSSLGLLTIVFLGSHRIAGLLLLVAYVVFLVLEFTVYRR